MLLLIQILHVVICAVQIEQKMRRPENSQILFVSVATMHDSWWSSRIVQIISQAWEVAAIHDSRSIFRHFWVLSKEFHNGLFQSRDLRIHLHNIKKNNEYSTDMLCQDNQAD